MKSQDFQFVQTKTVNLKNDIEKLTKCFPEITKIYLFGSRAYKTNSSRSDIDLIVMSSTGIPDVNLISFRIEKNYQYLDIFVGDNKSISSVANGARIHKRGIKSLVKQLDAVLLWTKKGFKNIDYLIQYVFEGQQFFDSARPYPKEFISLKEKINNPKLPPESQFCFQESLVNFVNECFLSSVAMFGLACECLINELAEKCSNKYLSDGHSEGWINHYAGGRNTSKAKVLGLEQYFKDYNNYFKDQGFTELDNSMRAFDVVRNYRNNADHPLGYTFHYDDCCFMFSAMSIHIDKILDVIEYLNNLG